jgi:hypothetical protein
VGRFITRVRLQSPHDQITDQFANGHAVERSFNSELHDHVMCEWQFCRSFLATILHANREVCHVCGFRWLRWKHGTGLSRGRIPLLRMGRRRLIPKREHVTCSEPTVTPINSAISSRLLPRSTRFLIC